MGFFMISLIATILSTSIGISSYQIVGHLSKTLLEEYEPKKPLELVKDYQLKGDNPNHYGFEYREIDINSEDYVYLKGCNF